VCWTGTLTYRVIEPICSIWTSSKTTLLSQTIFRASSSPQPMSSKDLSRRIGWTRSNNIYRRTKPKRLWTTNGSMIDTAKMESLIWLNVAVSLFRKESSSKLWGRLSYKTQMIGGKETSWKSRIIIREKFRGKRVCTLGLFIFKKIKNFSGWKIGIMILSICPKCLANRILKTALIFQIKRRA
jgi:hypothetical protein